MSGAAAALARRQRYSRIAHRGLAFAGPFTQAAIDAILDRLRPEPPAEALDLGCGGAEFLIQLSEKFGTRGTGVDLDAETLSAARAAAELRGVSTHLCLLDGEAQSTKLPASQDFVICLGASHAVGGWREAWRVMRAQARPGGLLLLGEGYWRRTPPPEYLELLGGSVADLPSTEELRTAAKQAGTAVFWSRESTLADWDHYEGSYRANMMNYLRRHPGDPDAEAFRTRCESWYEGFERWGRGTLGYSLLLARAPG